MTLFVYVTENCRADAKTHALVDELERFRERVEATQSTSLFDPFPPPYLVKKKLGGRQGRLIASMKEVGESDAVVVFLSIMVRGSRAYDKEFSAEPVAYGNQHFRGLVSDAELSAYVEARGRTASSPAKPRPSNIEYGLLYDAFSHRGGDASEIMVCETNDWVEAVASDRVAKQLALFVKPCLDALSVDDGLHFLAIDAKPGWGVWVLKRPEHLLLISPVTDANSGQARQLAENLAGELGGNDSPGVLPLSRRAYPAIVLADDDLWIDLEREPVANFALSPEESEVLESARHSDHPFPLFINGRAGSGKSTILQYLFSDLLFSYLSKPEARAVAPPVYLTANQDLLRNARQFVARLLRSEATLAQQPLPLSETERDEILDASFRDFYGYILSLLEPKDRRDKFARANRVDYSRFRALWTDRFGKDRAALRDFGPELSWHVIRSYIKGMSSETYLEPDDYSQLPENQLTVSQGTYQMVYDRVWLGWYREVTEGASLWDDQDLTRFVLDSDLAKPVHPSVFCDEAQDFTRLELELILRINLFSNRALSRSDVQKVCFAFAGDQFQTLNPTGFRWDAIKATFVEKFVFEMDPGSRGARTDLNYRELKFNYRSSDRIVRFCNLVQVARAALFRLPELRPQEPWKRNRASFPVTWFRETDGNFWKKFRESASFVVIVPCAEGEEAAYVADNPHLREHVQVEDGVPLNVLSASRAKGCEYPAVIVYGFGATVDADILGRIGTSSHVEESDRIKDLSLQYFINRLYVSVSRPKQRLVIVDSDEGLERLWKFACDQGSEANVLDSVKNGQAIWGAFVEGMSVGNPEDLLKDVATDPTENAKAFEKDAVSRRDSFLFKQAAQAYRIAGDQAKARECRARALECDGECLEAGRLFREAGFGATDAVRCLWKAGRAGWADIAELEQRFPEIRQNLEVQFAQSLVVSTEWSSGIRVLEEFARRLEEPTFAESCAGVVQWRDAVVELVRRVSGDRQRIQRDQWRRLATVLDAIRKHGIGSGGADWAEVYFAAERYGDAVALWEEGGATRDRKYMRAKALTQPYPTRVVPLAALDEWKEIADGFRGSRDAAVSNEEAGFIVEALLLEGCLRDAYEVAWRGRCLDPMFKVAERAFQASDQGLGAQALRAAVMASVIQKNWDVAATLLPPAEFRPAALAAGYAVRRSMTEEVAGLRALLVRILARPSDLGTAPGQFQRRWSDFLRQYLRMDNDEWHDVVTIEEAGAAIERTGRFADAIAYYEALRTATLTGAQRRFLKERLLVTKDRQLRYEQAQRPSGKTRQLERDLRQAMASMHIESISQLPEYPRLPELPEPEGREETAPVTGMGQAGVLKADVHGDHGGRELPDRLQATLGSFSLELSRQVERLNIKNNETLETGFLKYAKQECGGEMTFRRVGNENWICEDPKITISHSAESGHIKVAIEDVGAAVEFSV